jgi:hypothetical protein
MGRICNMNGEKRNAYNLLMVKIEAKETNRKTNTRLMDNIKMDVREMR